MPEPCVLFPSWHAHFLFIYVYSFLGFLSQSSGLSHSGLFAIHEHLCRWANVRLFLRTGLPPVSVLIQCIYYLCLFKKCELLGCIPALTWERWELDENIGSMHTAPILSNNGLVMLVHALMWEDTGKQFTVMVSRDPACMHPLPPCIHCIWVSCVKQYIFSRGKYYFFKQMKKNLIIIDQPMYILKHTTHLKITARQAMLFCALLFSNAIEWSQWSQWLLSYAHWALR